MSVTIDHKAENAAPDQAPVSDRAWALYRALDGKGLVPDGYVEGWKKTFEEDFSPRRGAELVARAWTDPEFRDLLLTDGTAAVAQYGYLGPQGEYIVAVEDTDTLKNVIVCSLCSCTAWPILGLPPTWYKGFEYRARVVREPRKVLSEMGTDLPDDVEIRVYDTTAETRYMVLPQRPAGTEGWSQEQLREIVTKDCLIGVALPHLPTD
ncbi:nitrile hydratase subunit alpha [Rhodococcus sp. 06-156-3C]|uniref:nitrile hydratase subunit alpha n=1 Tax=Nocardiaceae TaxID=85025 RepID=UPI000522E71E|nr:MULTISPECIES: nitrile hydratase subunit alpha [Rhodococcus]OZD11569.1 nitrile hydratase subunit alpha [Rhodococcus sp. 06-156-3C]OZD13802.1 nitrile hydratase subunit alpha [Rhodococcus sp. 06-156-4a]OZD22230.1 nitrile hydratase subunit alpha [Rhodococcus sp. 06-156-4C]OZD30431.1 nitrile hydratase subunit alpha [Rhodococcus sp. 06-156-3]OZD37719.1 nitrile hydratase subunit alpha [Rhodococcus sp. 06-156-3b]